MKKNITIISVLVVLSVIILLTLYYLSNKGGEIPKEDAVRQTTSAVKDTVKDDTNEFGLAEEITTPSYSITKGSYYQENVRVEYPQITGLADTDIELIVNDIIKDNVDKRNEDNTSNAGLHVNETYQVTMNSNEYISILYIRGHYIEGNSQHWDTVLYGITIDLQTGKKLELSDFVTLDREFVQKIKQSTAVTNELVKNGMDKNKLIDAIKQIGESDILYGLQEGWNSYTYYLTQDSLVISLGVSYELGDYALVEFPGKYAQK